MVNLNCHICEQGCVLADGKTGLCGMYEQKQGRIEERFADRYLVACPISIETMPILHYFPGGKFLQISTTGCNFNCPGCISAVIVREMPPDSPVFQTLTPEQIVNKAIEETCMGIAFLMNDPLASFPTFLRVAKLARSKGLRVGCSSNTYFTEKALAQLTPYLDFINIGMKGFFDKAYYACGASSGIAPVLRNIRSLVCSGVHVEISAILMKDNAEELTDLAMFISQISPAIPLQVMRFIPFEGADISQEPNVRDAENFCTELRKILPFVYLFNTPGTTLLHTACPDCNHTVYKRDFYGPMGAKPYEVPPVSLQNGRCPECRKNLNMTGVSPQTPYQEGDFQGGYPFTRALEMVEAMLIAMGVRDKSKLAKAWEALLGKGGLKKLHHGIQTPGAYIQGLRHFGKIAQVPDAAEELAVYLEEKLLPIESGVASATAYPRVYYTMAKPLFYLNYSRLENQLTETAGGTSVNRFLESGGRPGQTLTVEKLNALNPDVIFISAFISNTVNDFYQECLDLGIEANAVKNRRIFTPPCPGWDFGSPRWILGLMYMANVLHPERFDFNVMAEATYFYRKFYQMEFSPSRVNRSFSKPDREWQWS
ncbi:radical SAM protein [Desulfobacter vibrioformis]|uniref:radical SAM protein n=1 Tax=Desulfobacter vibrioformis TaxID=34031 RepID=UPI000557011B|nr:radical SAM protein [Desulfobacter vibrioformis]